MLLRAALLQLLWVFDWWGRRAFVATALQAPGSSADPHAAYAHLACRSQSVP